MANNNSLRITCPTCGGPLPRDPQMIVAALKENTIRWQTIKVLSRHFGIRMAASEMAVQVYANRPDGGPLGAAQNMRVYVHQARKLLQPYGLTIEGSNGGGGYRLKWDTKRLAPGHDWLLVEGQKSGAKGMAP